MFFLLILLPWLKSSSIYKHINMFFSFLHRSNFCIACLICLIFIASGVCRPTSPWLLYCVWLLYRRVMNWEVCWICGLCRCLGGGLVFSNCRSNWAHDVLYKDRTVKYRVRKSRCELFSNPSDLENHSEVGFFSFGQLRMRSAGLEWPEGTFKDLTTFYDINCFSETWIMQSPTELDSCGWEPNSFFVVLWVEV